MSLFSKLSYVSRRQKLELFYKIFCPTEAMRVLDVGAAINPVGDGHLQFIDTYLWKDKLSAVNINLDDILLIKKCYPEVEAILGDACVLPWPNKYFDIVYSNAVIEHVGDFENQKKMASEIMRVGKGWFVATPNRLYPFEFHMRLPFVTWLPHRAYLYVGQLISYSHVQKKYMFGLRHDNTRLLTAARLKKCFPTSRIIRQRVTFMAETLIAVGGEVKIQRAVTAGVGHN